MTQLTGRCLCGKIHYSSEGEVKNIAVCHCKSCQLETGSAFAILLVVDKSSLRIEGEGLKSFTRPGGSGKPKTMYFCGDCGTTIAHESTLAPGMAFIRAGTLDDPSWVKPKVHIWVEEKQPWVTIPDGVPQFARNRE